MLIKTPIEFINLAAQGRCGNTPHIWLDVAQCAKEIGCRAVFVTSTHRDCDAFNFYNADQAVLNSIMRQIEKTGMVQCPNGAIAFPDSIYCMEVPSAQAQSAVDAFQADWISDSRYMIWDCSNQPWGQRKRAGLFSRTEGLRTELTLRMFLNPADIDELQELADKYPGAVVEFTKFPWAMGRYGSGLTIWEVRHY